MFVVLAVVFALGFVVFGVGSGSSGLSDALQSAFHFGGSGGTSISSLEKKTAAHPNDPKAWRDLATAYEQKGRTEDAVSALQRYLALKPKNADALGELGERVAVLRAQSGVLRQSDDRVVRPLLRLVGGREVAPRLGIERVLLRLLLEARDRRAAGRPAERVLERVGDPVRAGADAEEDEAKPEHEGQEHERPLRMDAQALEEQLLLPLGRAPLPGCRYGRSGCGLLSIRARAALAMLRTSRHCVSSAFR